MSKYNTMECQMYDWSDAHKNDEYIVNVFARREDQTSVYLRL